jgi:deuterolysin
VSFIGAHARVARDNLNAESFLSIQKKKSIDMSFNLAEMYDIASGGEFSIIAEGGIPWAKKNSTQILGTESYKSNQITVKIDKLPRIPPSRNIMQSDCTAGRLAASTSANGACAFIAMSAGLAALYGDTDQ